jgi:hypothetical protein
MPTEWLKKCERIGVLPQSNFKVIKEKAKTRETIPLKQISIRKKGQDWFNFK